jgi:hypothetical protein
LIWKDDRDACLLCCTLDSSADTFDVRRLEVSVAADERSVSLPRGIDEDARQVCLKWIGIDW